MRSALPCLAFAALLLGGVEATAGQPPIEYSVEYAAPAGCPDVDAFIRAVTLRVPHARAVPSAAPKIRFRVEQPSTSADGAALTFTVLVEGEGSSTRQVPAVPCDDAIASMAVIAALVLESQKLEAADAPVPAAPIPEPAPRPPPVAGEAPRAAPPRPQPPAGPALPLELRAVAGAAVVGAAAPGPAFGAWAGADLRWGDTLQGSARLSALYMPPVTVSTTAGDAELRLLLGRASVCPVSIAVSALRVFPCAHLEAGSLNAEGVRALNRREAALLWLSGGASLRPEVSLLPFLSLEAEATVLGLLRHDRFTFDPGVTAHDVPPFSYRFGLGLSISLWDTGPTTP